MARKTCTAFVCLVCVFLTVSFVMMTQNQRMVAGLPINTEVAWEQVSRLVQLNPGLAVEKEDQSYGGKLNDTVHSLATQRAFTSQPGQVETPLAALHTTQLGSFRPTTTSHSLESPQEPKGETKDESQEEVISADIGLEQRHLSTSLPTSTEMPLIPAQLDTETVNLREAQLDLGTVKEEEEVRQPPTPHAQQDLLRDFFPGFAEQARKANFDAEHFLDKGWPRRQDQVTQYLELLMQNRRQVPLVPATVTTRPQPLESPPKCTGQFFDGPRDRPAWIVVILTLAYELDMLEIQLYELNDVADEFVVFEGTHTQRGAQKPVLFEKEKQRFEKFLPKIRHYVQTASEVKFKQKAEAQKGQVWTNEGIRGHAYKRYVAEQKDKGESLKNTLFVNADIDEIAPANGLQRFKFCKTTKLWSNFCSLMYEPDMETVHLFPNQCGRLGRHYWPHPNILREGEPLRGEGHNPYDELVGIHLHIRDPWSAVSRVLSTAEGAWFGKFVNCTKGSFEPHEILNPSLVYKSIVCGLKEKRVHNEKQPDFQKMPVNEFSSQKARPWFLEANKARFPYAWPSHFKRYQFDCKEAWDAKFDYYKAKGLI